MRRYVVIVFLLMTVGLSAQQPADLAAALSAKVKAIKADLSAVESDLAVLLSALTPAPTPVPPTPPTVPVLPTRLLGKADLTLVGSFRVPATGAATGATFSYGGTGLAMGPSGNTLYLVGHAVGQMVTEVSIPLPLTGPLVGLNVATLVKPFTDISEGKKQLIDANVTDGVRVGGILAHKNKLLFTVYSYYDASGRQTRALFTSGQDVAITNDVGGPFSTTAPMAGMISGYLASVPTAWQTALGGPVVVGQCCIPIVGRTSWGPALFALNPDDVGVLDPVPVSPLLYYTQTKPLGPWDGVSDLYTGASEVAGIVIPEGTRSALFFGVHGRDFCYGSGTDDQTLHRKPTGRGDTYCYDPGSTSHGTHAYPSFAYIWAYNLADLAQVRAGATKPWDVRPYATWTLDLPYGGVRVGGVTYDSTTGRIFVSQRLADGDRPLIHVYGVRP